MFAITSFFSAIAGLMLIALSINTIRTRQTLRVLIGDGGYEKMQRAIRAQANFCEYVPLALLMMGLLEAQGRGKGLLICFGTILMLARASHAYSLVKAEPRTDNVSFIHRIKFRTIGMIGTFGVIGFESFLLLF